MRDNFEGENVLLVEGIVSCIMHSTSLQFLRAELMAVGARLKDSQ